MDAVAVQRKENDKAAKPAANVKAETQSQETADTGVTAGLPLFMQSSHQASAAAPPSHPGSRVTPLIQRQAQQDEDEDAVQAKRDSAFLIQRQPIEEEEELLQPKCCDAGVRQPPLEEEEAQLQPKLNSAAVQRQPLRIE